MFVTGACPSRIDEMVNGIRFSSQSNVGSSNTIGHRYLHSFSTYPPSWIFMIDDIVIKKTITFDGNLSVIYDITGDAISASAP